MISFGIHKFSCRIFLMLEKIHTRSLIMYGRKSLLFAYILASSNFSCENRVVFIWFCVVHASHSKSFCSVVFFFLFNSLPRDCYVPATTTERYRTTWWSKLVWILWETCTALHKHTHIHTHTRTGSTKFAPTNIFVALRIYDFVKRSQSCCELFEFTTGFGEVRADSLLTAVHCCCCVCNGSIVEMEWGRVGFSSQVAILFRICVISFGSLFRSSIYVVVCVIVQSHSKNQKKNQIK